MTLTPTLRREITTTIRLLAADAIQAANSGHPGAPMGQADFAWLLWHEFLRFDPDDTKWAARDRFVLSCGHGSTLLYSLLHLWDMGLSLDDIKAFRQWGSKTPGHPEVGHTAGVEMTTGPLGQGAATSVGMAAAAKMAAAKVKVKGDHFEVMPQRIFTVCGDGDLMEGVSYESASLAGQWQLDNLVWLYDDNRITIDGTTDLAFTEDVEARFKAQGWRVLRVDGHDVDEVRAALTIATVSTTPKPTLIMCRTHIGFGSPNRVDTSGVHGSPLGADELALTRVQLGWDADTPSFHVPDEVRTFLAEARAKKCAERAEYDVEFEAWRGRNPEAAATYDAIWSNEMAPTLTEALLEAVPAAGATRKLSNAVINAALSLVPGLVGGSADLAGSNGTKLSGVSLFGARDACGPYDVSYAGRQISFGIREHAMGAITNGISLHGGFTPFNATFMVFSDYLRPSIRLAALSGTRNIFILTHDSVFLGEDGPTHQPVEHHWALRVIPGLTYFRPADGVETAMAWAWALQEAEGPVAMGLTRQGLTEVPRPEGFEPADVWRGAYATNAVSDPELVLLGTGSEVAPCVAAGKLLEEEGRRVRVVSMPSYERFLAQPEAWQEALLPMDVPVVTVEAGITTPWRALAGRRGRCVGIDRFGASAPASVLAEEFGLTGEAIAAEARVLLG